MALNIKKGSLLFAPMEGVTDEEYRLVIDKLFGEWDYYSTDFLRVPTVGKPNAQRVLDHFGQRVFSNNRLLHKTSYQILTTYRAQTKDVVDILQESDVHHLDLNLGCPSRKVNAHHGGAYLLSDMPKLKEIIRIIRENFKKTFTVKIRTGYKNTDQFIDSLKLFEDEGVEAITIHGRTREQMYKGIANWDYIKQAVKSVSIPIIGNGDVWTARDVDRILDYTDCHAVMIGRGALKTPWLADIYREYEGKTHMINEEVLLYERVQNIQIYFLELLRRYTEIELEEEKILRRFKGLSQYLFEDFSHHEQIRSQLLRTQRLVHFLEGLESLSVRPPSQVSL